MADVDPMLTSPNAFENDTKFSYRKWVKRMECGTLNSFHFKEYWAKHVPSTFSLCPELDCSNITFNEDLVYNLLFLPLEQFICDNENPKTIFEHIKTTNSIPSLCGKVFKRGEPHYSCRDCAIDFTCVLCRDCFTKSAHRLHHYKMVTSSGGGYCDCGDEEAWKSDCYCEIHHKGKFQAESSNSVVESLPVLTKLPEEFVERLSFVFRVVLHYCYRMLTWIHAGDLPVDLQYHNQSPESEEAELSDTFCTVVFNDETHSYDQVIDSITDAVRCTRKAAIDFTTAIDKEGRCIVGCSKFSQCNHIRRIIERITSYPTSHPLKVLIMHTDVLSHQIHAMKLLAWLQQILKINAEFPIIFSQVMTGSYDDNNTLLESVMLNYILLWKAARNQWNQLFISGMLMDQRCKKVFAETFIKNYPVLVRDFLADDLEVYSASIISFSVQIFTIPTLAYFLIEEYDGIKTILKVFIGECEKHLNDNRKLALDQNDTAFQKARYMLYDLKYLISVVPTQWNPVFRLHFSYGLQSYLILLNCMQGMDSVVRQVGHHIELDAEWKAGIDLQFNIACVSVLILQWCGSDFHVYVQSVKATLAQFSRATKFHPLESSVKVLIAGHSANCIEYDVSSMPVTVHLPLSRFTAGLFLYLEKFELCHDDPQFKVQNSEMPKPEHLMEFPLRTLVMLAQIRAGMWRRNGNSLLSQVYFYQSVKYRGEMFDRDIIMLQIVASIVESNEYLIHLAYKFGLLNWADENYDRTVKKLEDDSIKQNVIVAEEFLSLLLMIISERFTPGIGDVSKSQKIQKEIIQLLCIEPMTHSDLSKMLPKDPNNETGMEGIVDEVASFKKPQNAGIGKYELKPECFKCFNPFYYHYTKEQQSNAEIAQLDRKRQMKAELYCPPPVPPEFTSRLSVVTNLLQCDVMLHFIHLVFARTLNFQCVLFSEAQLEKTIHIVGVALHEEERFISKGENSRFCFTAKAVAKGIPVLMEECLKIPRIESHKGILHWALAKFKFVESLHVSKKEDNDASINGDQSEMLMGESSRDKKSKAAAARRARIMDQMSTLQKNFIEKNADFFKQIIIKDTANMSDSQSDINSELGTSDPISIGGNQRGQVICQKMHTCVICHEIQEASCTGRTLVLVAFVQRSSVLSKNRKANLGQKSYDPFQLSSDLSYALHISTCGHVMHSDCSGEFFDSVLRKEQRRILRSGRRTRFDVEKNEYLCPLCVRLSNTVIPMIPQLATLVPKRNCSLVNISFHDWLGVMKKTAEESQYNKKIFPPSDDEEAKYFSQYNLPKVKLAAVVCELPENLGREFLTMFTSFHNCTHDYPEFSVNLLNVMKLFSETTYTVGLQRGPNMRDSRVPAMSWWSCACTIHAMEWLLRKQNKPLFGGLSEGNALCLQTVVRFAGCSLKVFDWNSVLTQCTDLLHYLLLEEHYLSSPQCALELDAFAVLMVLSLSMPILFPFGGTATCAHPIVLCPLGSDLDVYLLHLLYTFHLVQLLLTATFVEDDFMDVDGTDDSSEFTDTATVVHFYQDIRTASGLDQDKSSPSGFTILRYIKSGSLPFLRCAALFFHVLTDTPPPLMLQEKANEFEYDHICKYLGLPTSVHELLKSPSLKQLALSWARHPRTLHLLQLGLASSKASKEFEKAVECLVYQPLLVNHLIPLPMDFSELVNRTAFSTCPNSDNTNRRNPTMCLVCGAVLCSRSYCCELDLDGSRVGPCTHHANVCGADIGVFLRILNCEILLLSDRNKGCFIPAPYVDDYGETDQGLLRGNPLHLCFEEYEKLNDLWLSHNIPERVSYVMDQPTALPTWELF